MEKEELIKFMEGLLGSFEIEKMSRGEVLRLLQKRFLSMFFDDRGEPSFPSLREVEKK